ncbi:MAG: DnaJ domain-containing protein [Acidobacteria bacterium]|nr:DnaJ domain-containing protein [Acidobacteriota bacterium]
MNGRLSEQPLAELLREIAAAALSGALRLARERVKAVVYAQGGEIVHARSNLRAHRLVECARRAGLVEAGELAETVTEMMSDAEACDALLKSGALDGAGVARLRARQAQDVLKTVLLWTDGTWEFDPRARLSEDARAHVDLRQLLLEGARHLPVDFCAARFPAEEEMISPAAAPPQHLQLVPVEAFVLSRADSPSRLCDLVAQCGMPETQSRQAVYGLALAGFLARGGWPQSLAGVSPPRAGGSAHAPASEETGKVEKVEALAREEDATPDPLEEVNALLVRAAASDYYEMLGVGRLAGDSDIKRAYYALAKRFHPDRFLRTVDGETRSRVEDAFAQIAHAYETLRDQRERANYDSKLDARPPAPPRGDEAASSRAAAGDAEAEAIPRVVADPSLKPEYRAEENFQLGLPALRRGDAEAAALYFGEAVRLAPQQARYRAFYGRALTANPQTRRQAESELHAAVRLDPQNPSYHVALAELYAAIGLQRRVEGELERALALDPKHDGALKMIERMKGQ